MNNNSNIESDPQLNKLKENIPFIKNTSLKTMLLSSNCISQSKNARRLIKDYFKMKFNNDLKFISERLKKYENNDDCIINISEIQSIFDLNDDSSDSDSFKMTVKNIQLFNDILENLTNEVKLNIKRFLPLNKRVYFLDQEIDFVDFIFRKIFYKILRKNKKNLKKFVEKCLIITKKIFDKSDAKTILDRFSKYLKNFLNYLKIFGLRQSVLESSKESLISIDISHLSPLKTNFKYVFKYLENQKYIYSNRFHRNIEERILNELYKGIELDHTMILNDDLISCIYTMFYKAGLKDRLINSFSKIYPERIKVETFIDFVEINMKMKNILKILNDKDFDEFYMKYFQNILESAENCFEIAKFVDKAVINTHNTSTNTSINRNESEMAFLEIANIIENSKNPETLLKFLRENLSLRLIKMMQNDSDSIQNELLFLKYLKKMYSENMNSMIKDYQKMRNEKSNNELLAMTMCKWPMFKTKDLNLNQIDSIKNEISQKFKEEKKKISWIDSLSTVTVILFDKKVKLSLFQYSLVLEMINDGISIKETPSYFNHTSSSLNNTLNDSVKISKFNQDIPKIYNSQYESILNDLVLIKNDGFVLNPYFSKDSYLNFKIDFESVLIQENEENTYDLKYYNESRMAKILKRIKNTNLKEISKELKDLDENQIAECLKSLKDKGICEIKDSNIEYLP